MANQPVVIKVSPRANDEVGRGRPGKYLAVSMAVILIGVIVTNYWVSGYLNRNTTNFGAWLTHRKWEMLSEQKTPVDVLILGDSTCNQGINPNVIKQEHGLSSLNLCTTGPSALVGDAWMLEEYVRRVGPPKHVIIGHAYDVWFRNLDPSIWPNVPRPGLAYTQSSIKLGKDRVVSALIRQNLPLYSQDLTLKSMLMPNGPKLPGPDALDPNKALVVDALGFYSESGPNLRAVRRDLGRWARKKKYPAFLSSDNKQAIEEVARLADEHDFSVTYVNGPFYDQAYEKPNVKSFVDRQAQVVKAFFKDRPSLRYCRNRHLFPAAMLRNVDHISVEGSIEYTKRVLQLAFAMPDVTCE